MCTVCGCGQPGKGPGHAHDHDHHHDHDHDHHHDHDHGHDHSHDHDHDHDHGHDHDHDHGHIHFGDNAAGASVVGMTTERIVQVERDILSKNDELAQANRRWFADHGMFVVNLVSSPGAGKTTLLVRTVEELKGKFPLAVVEGDQQTSVDADRIRATEVPALQINTGKGCHLDAHMVGHAMEQIETPDDGVLFIENVGNLVCPAGFDLGEAMKVVILSVTEGEDKPLKYPDMFAASGLMILNKVDLLPYVSFDVDRCVEYARRINPDIEVLKVSATSGEGMDAWTGWIAAQREAALRQRISSLEAQLAEARNKLGAGA